MPTTIRHLGQVVKIYRRTDGAWHGTYLTPGGRQQFVRSRLEDAKRHARKICEGLAILEDTAKVALEAGNSPTMIFRNYRELVTKSDAEMWFRD